MPAVEITVTSAKKGNWTLRPYNRTQKVRCAPNYWVPTYQMIVHGVKGSFEVIRFGIQRRDRIPVPKTWTCDCGLFAGRTYDAKWIPSYRPVSFRGSIAGDWLLDRKGSFLIHEGTVNSYDPLGTFGCVEVLGAKGGATEWSRFLRGIIGVSGRSYADFHKVQLRVTIRKAAYPIAESKVKDASVRRALGNVLAKGPYGSYEISRKGIETIIRSTYREGLARKRSKVTSQEISDMFEIRMGYELEESGARLLDEFIDNPKKFVDNPKNRI